MSGPIVITLAVVGLAAVAALLWLWWWVPKWQMRSITAADPKARADIEDNFRKTIGQILVGIGAVLIGSAFTYLQFFQQQRQSSQQAQAARDTLMSNEVATYFERLGSDKGVVRLGGIYALEGVMKISPQYHKPVLEALCAFVRDGTRTETGGGPPATDFQAALTVIGRNSAGLGLVDLADAHIPKAKLPGANLTADLRGANLSDANLIGANLSDANLGDASLTGASLTRAKLPRANLGGANLTGADLSGATVTQRQLDQACGINVKLDPGLILNKPCP